MAIRAVNLPGGGLFVRAAIHVGIGCVGINDTRVIFPAAAATHVACETQAGDRNNQDQDETQCDNLFHGIILLSINEYME